MQTVRVYILDDLGQPILEGPETFELVLTMPMNAVLGAPALTVVTINDTISDCKYRGLGELPWLWIWFPWLWVVNALILCFHKSCYPKNWVCLHNLEVFCAVFEILYRMCKDIFLLILVLIQVRNSN